jgi:DNA-binding Xre family transcriptional regulator
MSKHVRLTLARAIAKSNLLRAEAGRKPITMNSLAVQAGVAATTITRLARTDDKAASALSLDLASKIVTVLDCGIEDLLEVTGKRPWICIRNPKKWTSTSCFFAICRTGGRLHFSWFSTACSPFKSCYFTMRFKTFPLLAVRLLHLPHLNHLLSIEYST